MLIKIFVFFFFRSLKMGPDGDDDTIEMNPSKSMNITYVNFEKTKPNIKPVSEELSNTLLKKSNSSKSISNKCNGQTNHGETSNNVTEKVKTKKQNKSPSVEHKQSDGNPRHSKKLKRDV